jgi:hypothetical protein
MAECCYFSDFVSSAAIELNCFEFRPRVILAITAGQVAGWLQRICGSGWQKKIREGV